jgi:predicted transcriptional regulator
MDVSLNPDLAARLEQWAAQTGRDPEELIADAMAGYFAELSRTRELIDGRYESLRSGKADLVDGDEALRMLKQSTDAQRRRA